MITQAEYEAKRTARYERLLAAATKAQNESNALVTQGSAMASMIPFGQPILVGHHSEGRDRNYRGRIENKFRKGFELSKKADELKERASSALHNDAIYTDDPTATDQLKEKLARLETHHAHMVATNKAIKKGSRAALLELGHSAATVDRWLDPAPMAWPGKGFARFELSNNNATIRNTKQRLELVSKKQAIPDKDETIGEVKIEWRASENRIRLFYPGRVDTETFKALRQHGYRAMKETGGFSAYYNYNAGAFINQLKKTK